MKRSKFEKVLATIAFGLVLSIPLVQAEESKMDKAGDAIHEGANDTKRAAKKAVRGAKDKGCELVNGKMDCAGKKLKHKAQNAGDKMEDAAD